jgi:hypothetical protein
VGTSISFTNKIDHHNITEILLKEALNIHRQNKQSNTDTCNQKPNNQSKTDLHVLQLKIKQPIKK